MKISLARCCSGGNLTNVRFSVSGSGYLRIGDFNPQPSGTVNPAGNCIIVGATVFGGTGNVSQTLTLTANAIQNGQVVTATKQVMIMI